MQAENLELKKKVNELKKKLDEEDELRKKLDKNRILLEDFDPEEYSKL